MIKLSRKDILVAKCVNSLTLMVDAFDGSPVISIGHECLKGLIGVVFPDSKTEASFGDFIVRVDDEGRLIVRVAWDRELDEEYGEYVNLYEEVDVTDLVIVRLRADDPALGNFRDARERPEWHEYYMSKKTFKFLSNVIQEEEEEEE